MNFQHSQVFSMTLLLDASEGLTVEGDTLSACNMQAVLCLSLYHIAKLHEHSREARFLHR
jgi:hypothetical protein